MSEVIGGHGALEAIDGDLAPRAHHARVIDQTVDVVQLLGERVAQTAHLVELGEIGHP